MNSKSIIRGIKDPKLGMYYLLGSKAARIIPDKMLIKLKYQATCGRKLELKNPERFNDKLQWLKLYDRKPRYTRLADKYEAKQYIKENIGEEYIIPLLGVYDSFEEIDFEQLPEQFVLKPNHTSGDIYICKDKSKIDYGELKKNVDQWMKKNYYWLHREWPYKNIRPRIICEPYMVDESGTELKDYKIFCFDGQPKIIEVDFNRFIGHQRNFYTTEWQYMDFMLEYPNDKDREIKKPAKLDEMLDLAEKLSAGIPHVRVDLYSINGNIYFGEVTFYHESGYGAFKPDSYNYLLGSWINLPR